MSATIVINQDYEVDEDEVGGRVQCWWAEGHGLDRDDFIRAVVEHCLYEEQSIPLISFDDPPISEVWQRTSSLGQSTWVYQRQAALSDYSQRGIRQSDWVPVTVLDIERVHAGWRCMIDNCRRPGIVSTPVKVVVEADATSQTAHLVVCREHLKQFPQPSYRVCMIPAGATIVLDDPAVAS